MSTRNGKGKIVSATATGESVTVSGAHQIKAHNAGSDVAYVGVDLTVAELLALIVAGSALPIVSGQSYTFSEGGSIATYTNVVIACATGDTATVYLEAN